MDTACDKRNNAYKSCCLWLNGDGLQQSDMHETNVTGLRDK